MSNDDVNSKRQQQELTVLRADAPTFVPSTVGAGVATRCDIKGNGDVSQPPKTTTSSGKTRNGERRKHDRHRRPGQQQQQQEKNRGQRTETNRVKKQQSVIDSNDHKKKNNRQRTSRPQRFRQNRQQSRNSSSRTASSRSTDSMDESQEYNFARTDPRYFEEFVLPCIQFLGEEEKLPEEEEYPRLRSSCTIKDNKTDDDDNNFTTTRRQTVSSVWDQEIASKVLGGNPDDNADDIGVVLTKMDSRLLDSGLEVLTATRPSSVLSTGLETRRDEHGDDHEEEELNAKIGELKKPDGKDRYNRPRDHVDDDLSHGEQRNPEIASDVRKLIGTETSKCYKSFSNRMDRLRDRWWDAMTKRQVQQQRQRQQEEEQRRQRDEEERRQQRQQQQQQQQQRQNVTSDDEAKGLIHQSELYDVHLSAGNENDKSEGLEIDIAAISSQSSQVLDSQSSQVLEDIICREDDVRLRQLLSSMEVSQGNGNDFKKEDIIRQVVILVVMKNKAQLLRLVMSYTDAWGVSFDSFSFSSSGTNPFFIAAEKGYEECLSSLLSGRNKSSTLASLKDEDGNNILHICCAGEADDCALRCLLDEMNSKGRQHFSKLILAQNNKKQTPLHVACECKKASFVDVFLSTCTSSLLAKILASTDDQGRTPLLTAISISSEEIVLALIMWRGNHTSAPKTAPVYFSPQVLTLDVIGQQRSDGSNNGQRCPLDWAAKQGNLEMVDLLLQFGDQWGRKYRLTEALMSMLTSSADQSNKLEGCHMLVAAGANPFQQVAESLQTPVGLAADLEELYIVKSLIQMGMKNLRKNQKVRREDPILRKRPPVFCRQLEEKEAKEVETALRLALLQSLYKSRDHGSLAIPVALCEAGTVRLEDSDLAMLQLSMKEGQMRSCPSPCLVKIDSRYFIATYIYHHDPLWMPQRSTKHTSITDRTSAFSYNTKRYLQLPWVKEKSKSMHCACRWVRENGAISLDCIRERNSVYEKEVVLICTEDGSRFTVHPSVVSIKSGKIESAIRFAEMRRSSDDDSVSDTLEVPIDGPSNLINSLLQHIYHGSVFLWSSVNDHGDDKSLCLFLLELMMFAEECLCPSLVQECEMRILSANPRMCACWSCCQAVTYNPKLNSCECLYYFMGRGRRNLINAETVLSILGVTDYAGDARGYNLYYRVIDERVNGDFNDLKGTSASFRGMSGLRDMAVRYILKEFQAVIESESFSDHSERNDDARAKELLMRLVLDGLKEDSIGPLSFRSSSISPSTLAAATGKRGSR